MTLLWWLGVREEFYYFAAGFGISSSLCLCVSAVKRISRENHHSGTEKNLMESDQNARDEPIDARKRD